MCLPVCPGSLFNLRYQSRATIPSLRRPGRPREGRPVPRHDYPCPSVRTKMRLPVATTWRWTGIASSHSTCQAPVSIFGLTSYHQAPPASFTGPCTRLLETRDRVVGMVLARSSIPNLSVTLLFFLCTGLY